MFLPVCPMVLKNQKSKYNYGLSKSDKQVVELFVPSPSSYDLIRWHRGML